MRLINRTIVFGNMLSAVANGVKPPKVPFTTLNQKLNVQNNAVINEGDVPTINVLVIGRGGYQMQNVGNIQRPVSYRHEPTDTGLFDLTPMVLRQVNNDLSAVERTQYCLRSHVIIRGTEYIQYSGKWLDPALNEPEMYYVRIRDGVTTTLPFVPNNSNMNPTPRVLAPNQSLPSLVNGDYVKTLLVRNVYLNEFDISEYINACRIIDGVEGTSIISEMAIATSLPRDIQTTGAGGATITFKEAILAQCAGFISDFKLAENLSQGFTVAIDVGVSEPLSTNETITAAFANNTISG